MINHTLTFDAIAESDPGPKWAARWSRSWPAYEAWFRARGGEAGPSRNECEATLAEYMPELAPVHRQLTCLAGGSDLAARFLSTWCPPRYLGGCSIASLSQHGMVRLVRNYDLSPDLNEGLLLRTEWSGTAVMGMTEFLWGLSDGINAAGLTAALAYGGRQQVARGFGVTTILRYALETCGTVDEALAALNRVPSHMAYNVTLADRHGSTATAELLPGGGVRVLRPAIATNHQHGPEHADCPSFTGTHQRHDYLRRLVTNGTRPDRLGEAFLQAPLYQRNFAQGFGTLFTAIYDPSKRRVMLRWPGHTWDQCLDAFAEGRRKISYNTGVKTSPINAQTRPNGFLEMMSALQPYVAPATARALESWARDARHGHMDWVGFGRAFAPVGPEICAAVLHNDGATSQ